MRWFSRTRWRRAAKTTEGGGFAVGLPPAGNVRNGDIDAHLIRAAGLYSRPNVFCGGGRADDSLRRRDRSDALSNAVFRSPELWMTPTLARFIPFFPYAQGFLEE